MPKRTHSAGSSSGLPGAYRARNKNKFYVEGRQELARAITLDEKKRYKDAMEHYVKAIEYHIAGYKRDSVVSHKAKVYQNIQSYIERAEVVKVLANSIAESDRQPQKSAPSVSEHQGRRGSDRHSDDSKASGAILFKDIKGLDFSKMALYESVILPQKQPQVFVGARKPFNGILLYGPPGTGKSMLAEALSNEANSYFLNVSASDIFAKGMGDSEKNLRDLFKLAREKKPCVMFIDEVDSIGRSRASGVNSDTESTRRVKTELLKQLDGFESNDGLMFLAATNTPWELDSALRRRLEKRIFTPLPSLKARADILKYEMGDEKCSMTESDYVKIAKKLEGYSSADCATIVREALMEPVRALLRSEYFRKVKNDNGIGFVACKAKDKGAIKMKIWTLNPDELITPTVTMKDFENATKRTKPSINVSDLHKHYEFAKSFGGMPDKNLESKLRAKEDIELARVSQQSDGGGIFQTIMQGLGGMLGLRTSRSVPPSRYSTKKSSNQKETTPRKSSESKKRKIAAPAMSIL